MNILSTEILLDRLRFYARHGVIEQERIVGAEYEVSLRLRLTDAHIAIEDDSLDGTVNYADVYATIRREMEIPSSLLEHVAGRILHALFAAFPLIEEIEVEVRKMNPPMGADGAGSAVRLTATRD